MNPETLLDIQLISSRYSVWFKLTIILLLVAFTNICNAQTETKNNSERHPNALINESSAYLLQHAYNPVDWYPWKPEILEKAKAENKLIVLSIGFSSCHWCHVMNAETFKDDEVAAFMNENFISIKVDREEKPDVDQVYMTALQLIKGSGGWPLNMIILPDGRPIYGSTYLPKKEWILVLDQLLKLYNSNPEKVEEIANQIVSGVKSSSRPVIDNSSSFAYKEVLEKSVLNLKKNWDFKNGGEGDGQKFPIPVNLNFLLDYVVMETDLETRDYLKLTLDNIANKGVYDHLGGGFFRYSTDASWQLPHFEKMLYDNAQLISTYSKAYRVFEDAIYKERVYETISFLERDMKTNSGGYAASINADTNGEEGASYFWSISELKELIPEDEFESFVTYFSLNVNQNSESQILMPNLEIESFLELKFTDLNFSELKNNWYAVLRKASHSRNKPDVDPKVIVSWNALLITGFVDAYKSFGDKEFLDKAIVLFNLLERDMGNKGHLNHLLNSENDASLYLQDYAFLLKASLDLYEVTLNDNYFKIAQKLEQDSKSIFLNSEHNYYKYSTNSNLLTSVYKTNDGVLPSGNAVVAYSLFKLGTLVSDRQMVYQYKLMLDNLKSSIIERPSSYGMWNNLMLFNSYPFYEVAVVGENALEFIKELYKKPIVNAFVYGSTVESGLELFKDRYEPNKTSIYVCTQYSCRLPVKKVKDALLLLKE